MMTIVAWRMTLGSALLPSLASAADLDPAKGSWVGEGISCSALENGGSDAVMTVRERSITFYESECVIRDVKRRGPEFRIETLCQGEGEMWREDVTLVVKGKNKLLMSGTEPYVRCK